MQIARMAHDFAGQMAGFDRLIRVPENSVFWNCAQSAHANATVGINAGYAAWRERMCFVQFRQADRSAGKRGRKSFQRERERRCQ